MKTALLVATTILILAIVSAKRIREEQGLRNSIEKAMIMEAFNDRVAFIATNLARIAMNGKRKQTSILDYFAKQPRKESPEQHKEEEKLEEKKKEEQPEQKEQPKQEQEELIKGNRKMLLRGQQPWLTNPSKHFVNYACLYSENLKGI